MRACWSEVVVVLASAGMLWAGTVEKRPGAAVAPGGLVRWVGAGTETCVLGARAWAPLGAECVYPVDLETPPGRLWLERVRAGRHERVAVRVTPYPYPAQRLTVADESKVTLSPSDLARAEREQRELARLWAHESPGPVALPLFPPLGGPHHGGRFGSRRIINGKPRSPHTGVDYAARAGAPVYAAADGIVVLDADLFFSGNSVVLDHGAGLQTMYFHLSRVDVRVGQQVRRGAVIGAVGATGRATGPHLHFGARWHGARIDPEPLFVGLAAAPRVGD